MPLTGHGRLTNIPQLSSAKPVIFSTPGGIYLCFTREEAGTESFLHNTLLIVVPVTEMQGGAG